LVILLALLQYVWFAIRVGSARGKYNIEAPACSGDEAFDRLFRIQQNTLEQLIVFVPSCFAFAYLVSGLWAAIVGVVFIIGRFLYAMEYTKDPKTRALGFALTFLPNAVLLVGSLIGVGIKLF
jgi:uncharacterized membrane protein YecN with MAPEG domain